MLPVQSGKPEPLLMAHVGRKIQSVHCYVEFLFLGTWLVAGAAAAQQAMPPTQPATAAATIADQRLAAVKSGAAQVSVLCGHGLAKCWDV